VSSWNDNVIMELSIWRISRKGHSGKKASSKFVAEGRNIQSWGFGYTQRIFHGTE
jgi:hypothetical protein